VSSPGEMEERIKQIMADVLDTDPLAIDGSSTMDTIESWDSLTHINLCLSLEQDFEVSFTVSDMEMMLSYDDILRVIVERLR
jgi:acyl carrier protein